MQYMVTFTINIPQMLAYIPYMDPMGVNMGIRCISTLHPHKNIGSGITRKFLNSKQKKIGRFKARKSVTLTQ